MQCGQTDKLTGSVTSCNSVISCNGFVCAVNLKVRFYMSTIHVQVYWQPAHCTKTHRGCVIHNSCVSGIPHVIIFKSQMWLYNYTCHKHDDSNDIYLVSWQSVSSVRLSITPHYWLFAINEIYWIVSHLHETVDPKHIIIKQNFSFMVPNCCWQSQ